MKYIFLICFSFTLYAQNTDFVPTKGDNLFDLKPAYRGEEFIPNMIAKTIFDEDYLAGQEMYTTYLDEGEKSAYRVEVKNGRIYQNGRLYSTKMSRPRAHTIFIMDSDGSVYISDSNEMNKFHHSSFNRGQSVYAAGEIYIKDGYIIAVNNRSGHYAVDDHSLQTFRRRLKELGVDYSAEIRMFNFEKHTIDGHSYLLPKNIQSPCFLPFVPLF